MLGLGPMEALITSFVLIPWAAEIVIAIKMAKSKSRSRAFWGVLVGILGPITGLIPLALLFVLPAVSSVEPALRDHPAGQAVPSQLDETLISLTKLKELKEQGFLNNEEFEVERKRLIDQEFRQRTG